MLTRLKSDLPPRVPITVICGARSWLDAVNSGRLGRTGDLIREARPQGAYVGVEVMEGARHHLHAEKPHEFNHIVREALDTVEGEDR